MACCAETDKQSHLPTPSCTTNISVPSVLPGVVGVLHPGALERQMVLRTGEGWLSFPLHPILLWGCFPHITHGWRFHLQVQIPSLIPGTPALTPVCPNSGNWKKGSALCRFAFLLHTFAGSSVTLCLLSLPLLPRPLSELMVSRPNILPSHSLPLCDVLKYLEIWCPQANTSPSLWNQLLLPCPPLPKKENHPSSNQSQKPRYHSSLPVLTPGSSHPFLRFEIPSGFWWLLIFVFGPDLFSELLSSMSYLPTGHPHGHLKGILNPTWPTSTPGCLPRIWFPGGLRLLSKRRLCSAGTGHRFWTHSWLLLLTPPFKVHSESCSVWLYSETTVISLLDYCKGLLTGPLLSTLPVSISHTAASAIPLKWRSSLSVAWNLWRLPISLRTTVQVLTVADFLWPPCLPNPIHCWFPSLPLCSPPGLLALLWHPGCLVTKSLWRLFPVRGVVLLEIHTQLLLSFPSNSAQLIPKDGVFCSRPPPNSGALYPLIWLCFSVQRLTPNSSGTGEFIIQSLPSGKEALQGWGLTLVPRTAPATWVRTLTVMCGMKEWTDPPSHTVNQSQSHFCACPYRSPLPTPSTP